MAAPDDSVSVDPVTRDSKRWAELGWGDPTAMAAFMSVLRMQKQIVDNAHIALDELGLSITDLAALIYLGLTPDHRQPLGKIAQRLLIGPGRCSYVIDHLEAKGFVEREKHPTDKRTTLAALTRAGDACLHEAIERLEHISFGFGPVDIEVLATLVETLADARRIAGDLDENDFGPSQSSAMSPAGTDGRSKGGARR